MSRLHVSARSIAAMTAAAGSLAVAAPAMASTAGHHSFGVHQVNLVSDLPGKASVTDPDLVNPWGLAMTTGGPIWTSNAGTDTSTLYSSAPGSTTATKSSTVRVTLPGSPAVPTGQVFNGGTGFVLRNGRTSAPARFIFSTATGRIEAWASGVDPDLGDAEIKATVPGAGYTGLALATAKHGDQLYAANVLQGRIDVFNASFKHMTMPSWAFHDPSLPKEYAPFNVQTLKGDVFVTYAKPDPTTNVAKARGLGFVDQYTPDGRLIARVASRGSLNAPWGLAIAPSSWGDLAGSLLVGNFGDGRINVIKQKQGGRYDSHIQGQLTSGPAGRPLAIPGLWALLPGTAATGGTDSIWFSAGIEDEQHGLLGVLRRS